MLQRIQSIFLLLAAGCASATWFFPVRTWPMGESATFFMTRGLFNADGVELTDASLPVPFHLVHSVLSAALLVSIFLFGNRPRQARVIRGTWLVAMLLAGMQFISCNSIDAYFADGVKAAGAYGASFFLPMGAVLFTILAERAIKKDEALVRGADRLR